MGNVKITDPFFAKAIADISSNNSLFFTPKQFLYFLDRRLKSRSARIGCLWIVLYFFFSIWVPGFIGGILSMFLGKSSPLIVLFVLNIIVVDILFLASKSSKLNYQHRKANARRLQIIGGLILGIGIVASLVVFDSLSVFVASVLLGMLSIYLGTRQQMGQAEISQIFLFEQNQFQDWLNRWRQAHDPITKMLPSPRQESTPAVVSSEVSAYSFDRLVVCDSAIIAQLLIANNFHFENNCAVLSITGYPQSIFDTTMQMLRRNPDLKVYALHDCSPSGIGLVHRLRTSANWFANSNVMIFDVGLLPRQIFASPNVFIQASEESAQAAKQLPAAIRQDLSTTELKWLEAGKFVELESFTPQKLIQVLNRGIAGSRNLESDDSSLILVGDTGFVYASDSFG
jgi:hypothetical protein